MEKIEFVHNGRKYEYWKGVEDEVAKFPHTDDQALMPDKSKIAVEHLCTLHGMTLAREVMWCEEVVKEIGLDNYYSTGTFAYHDPRTDLQKIKNQLWESKAYEALKIKQFKWQGYDHLIPDFQALRKEEQLRINAAIVAHVMKHGDDHRILLTTVYTDFILSNRDSIFGLPSKP